MNDTTVLIIAVFSDLRGRKKGREWGGLFSFLIHRFFIMSESIPQAWLHGRMTFEGPSIWFNALLSQFDILNGFEQ